MKIRNPYQKTNPKRPGFTLLITIILGISFIMIGLAITQSSLANANFVRRDYNSLNALAAAEAGADAAITSLNANGAYTGTTTCPIATNPSGGVEFYNDATKGRVVYDTCIQNGTISNEKILYSRARLYRPQASATPTATRTVKVTLIGSNTAGNYSVQTGPGGLIMSNSAQISNGAVYVGGKITMSNTAKIGSVSNPVNTWAAYYNCPTPATAAYPQLCVTGQPISISNQAQINGEVRANNQTTTTGLVNPGLVANSGVAPVTLPDYNRAAQKSAVATTLTGAQASCSNNQSVIWPANVKITGNVSLSNNCQVTMYGNAWITGTLTLSNRSVIKLDNSILQQPTIMIDGAGGFNLSNQATLAANSASIGPQIITFWANSACSPDCVNLTGTGLANSQNVATITISNQGLGSAANFYARWSKVSVSNSGTVNKLLGQTIEFANTGAISFGLGGSTTQGATVWTVQYYDRQ